MTWVMKPEAAWSGPSPVCSTQGASSPWASSRFEGVSEPVAGAREQRRGVGEETSPPEPAESLPPEADPRGRPELDSENAEREVCVGHERVEHRLPGRSVCLRVPRELGHVVLERGGEERARTIRKRGSRGELGVQVCEPAAPELVLELGVRGGAREERMPGGEHLVREARCGQVRGGLDAAAEVVVPLEDADLPAGLREKRRAREGVDPGADEDRIEGRHRRATISVSFSLDMSRRRMTESHHAPARGGVRASVDRRRSNRPPRGERWSAGARRRADARQRHEGARGVSRRARRPRLARRAS